MAFSPSLYRINPDLGNFGQRIYVCQLTDLQLQFELLAVCCWTEELQEIYKWKSNLLQQINTPQGNIFLFPLAFSPQAKNATSPLGNQVCFNLSENLGFFQFRNIY